MKSTNLFDISGKYKWRSPLLTVAAGLLPITKTKVDSATFSKKFLKFSEKPLLCKTSNGTTDQLPPHLYAL